MTKIILGLPLFFLLASCGGESSSNQTGSENSLQPTERDLPTVAFGQPAKGSNLEIKIGSVEERSKVGVYGMGPKLNPGETFVVIRYTLKNIGTKPVERANQPDVELIDAENQEYARDNEAEVMEAIKNDDNSGTLNPNITSKQTAVWRVDKAAFNRATWRLKVSLDKTLDATLDTIERWPRDSKAPPPLMFKLK